MSFVPRIRLHSQFRSVALEPEGDEDHFDCGDKVRGVYDGPAQRGAISGMSVLNGEGRR
jgi:hypothetical protein